MNFLESYSKLERQFDSAMELNSQTTELLAIANQKLRAREPKDPFESIVVCAAIRNDRGIVICGPRHFDDIMRNQLSFLPEEDRKTFHDQGFVDQRGTYLTREEAREIAVRRCQIVQRVGGDEKRLYSENLY